MKLFDAHCHLQDNTLFPNIGNVIERAAAAGVEGIAICGTNSNDWKNVLVLSEKFSTRGERRRDLRRPHGQGGAFSMVGIHPWFVNCSAGAVTPPETAIMDRGYSWKKEFQCLEKLLRDFPNLGIGECGLDFGDKFQNRAEQEECFVAHLELATELNRPVAVHCVQAWGRMLDILREFPEPKKILHAFSGAVELIPELVKLNCWFSFGEAVINPNFKRARAAAVAVPLECLLIETDSCGEPEKLISVACAVAELRGVPVEEIAELTFGNARAIFG